MQAVLCVNVRLQSTMIRLPAKCTWVSTRKDALLVVVVQFWSLVVLTLTHLLTAACPALHNSRLRGPRQAAGRRPCPQYRCVALSRDGGIFLFQRQPRFRTRHGLSSRATSRESNCPADSIIIAPF